MVGAFAALQRALIMVVPDSDEVLAKQHRDLGFDAEESACMMTSLTDLTWWHKAGQPVPISADFLHASPDLVFAGRLDRESKQPLPELAPANPLRMRCSLLR